MNNSQVMELVVKENLVLTERRISLSEFHTADEVCFSFYIYTPNRPLEDEGPDFSIKPSRMTLKS